jgi:tetratricopeptide (TPR) repeat protein
VLFKILNILFLYFKPFIAVYDMHDTLPEDDRIVLDEPGYEEIFGRGMEYKKKCQYDDAIREFRAITEMVPDFSTAHFELAKAYLLNGNTPGALKEFERAARFEPDNLDIRFFLRHVPGFKKSLGEELKDAQMAVDANAGDAGAHDRLGVILMMMDSLDCGMQEIKWAVELAPDNAGYHLDLGYAESLFDEGEALRDAKAALCLEPKWLDAWLFLGALYMDLRRIGDATNSYKKAVALFPENDLLHYLLGDAYFSARNVKMARIEMETAVGLNPDNYEARRVLVGLYLIDDLKDKAIEQLEVLVKMEPGVKMARDKLEKLKGA